MRKPFFAFVALLGASSSGAEEMNFQDLLFDISNNLNAVSTSGATKTLGDTSAAPSIVKVYSKEDIARFESIYDLLKTAPGVEVAEGQFGRQYINIRNVRNSLYNNKTLLILNGFKIHDPTGPHFNLDMIPKDSIKRLEVIRGAGSVLYGSNAYSGVIVIETLDARGYQPNHLEFTLGSHGAQGLNGSVTEKTRHGGHYFAFELYGENGSDRVSDEDYARHSSVRNGYTGILRGQRYIRTFPGQASDLKLDYDNVSFLGVSTFDQTKFSYGHNRIYRDKSYQEASNIPFWGGIFQTARGIGPAHPLYRPPVLPIPASFDEPGRRLSVSHSEQSWFGVEHEHKVGERLSLKFLGNYTDSKEMIDENDLYIQRLDSSARSAEMDIQAHYQASRKLDVIAGFNREVMHFGQVTSGPNVNAASLIFTGTPILSNQYENVLPKSLATEGIYLQAMYEVNDRLTLLAANRRNSHSLLEHGYTPKVALTYKLNEGEYLKLIHGKAFRYPSPFELYSNLRTVSFRGSTNLLDEEVESTELNWTRSFNQERSTLGVTLFDMTMSSLLTPVNSTYQNAAAEVESKGLELEFSHNFDARLKGYGSFTLQDYDELSLTGVSPGEVQKMGSLGLAWKANRHLDVDLLTRYIGERSHDAATGFAQAGSETVHDIGVTYKHSDQHSLRFFVYNVLDKATTTIYQTVETHRMPTPPRGRMVKFSYRVQF